MHEFSVCRALVDQIEDLAKTHEVNKVDKVVVWMGPLAGVESSLLAQAYPLAAAGSVAEDAELIIETVPIRVRCLECESESDATLNRLLCAKCGGYRTEVVSGDEMLLARLEFTKPHA